MKIYTKTGDNGTSGLIGGTRVPKDDIRLDAYGSMDELNSFLGLLLCELTDEHDSAFILTIQHELFRIGSCLATDQTVKEPNILHPVSEEMLKKLENEIDAIQSALPEHHQFILPGGNKAASLCHICRTICRRVERLTVKVSKLYSVDRQVLVYLNRLSDYLFTLARKSCLKDMSEIYWDPSK